MTRKGTRPYIYIANNSNQYIKYESKSLDLCIYEYLQSALLPLLLCSHPQITENNRLMCRQINEDSLDCGVGRKLSFPWHLRWNSPLCPSRPAGPSFLTLSVSFFLSLSHSLGSSSSQGARPFSARPRPLTGLSAWRDPLWLLHSASFSALRLICHVSEKTSPTTLPPASLKLSITSPCKFSIEYHSLKAYFLGYVFLKILDLSSTCPYYNLLEQKFSTLPAVAPSHQKKHLSWMYQVMFK